MLVLSGTALGDSQQECQASTMAAYSVRSDHWFSCTWGMQPKGREQDWFPRHLHGNQWRCFIFFRIGCGLDRLQWENVSTIIEEVFEATDIRITVYTLWTDEHFGCDHVFLCQSYWAIGLGKLTSKMIRGKFHVKLSVTGHAWVSVFPWLDWDSEGGIAWEMLLWFFFSFLFRKVGNSLILGREPGVGPWSFLPQDAT